ncbi:helix-turn-helix domain-containing protein [Vibrio fluvialis]
MREWFLSTELVGLRGMANSSSGVAQKARRNNWLSRSSKAGNRTLEYHISNFHPDVKKQLIEKYVTDPDEAEKLMNMPEPRPITGIDIPYKQAKLIRDILVHKPDTDLTEHPELNISPSIAALFQENKAQALMWLQQRLDTQEIYNEEARKLITSKSKSVSDVMMRGRVAQDLLESVSFPDPEIQMALEQVVEESNRVGRKYNTTAHWGFPSSEDAEASNTEKKDVSYVTYYDITASAGAGRLVEYVPNKRVELSETLRLALNIQTPSRAKLLNMEGDSMHPTLKDKSILAIEELETFKQDGVYVFTFDNTLYVKRLQKSREGIKVISDNPIYDAWFINRDEVDTPMFTIHGRVTGCAQSV